MKKLFFIFIFIFAAAYTSTADVVEPQVIFIHGWNFLEEDYDSIKKPLQKIFPEHQIHLWKWDATDKNFEKCRKKALYESRRLAGFLMKLPEKKREKTILIGHSLGGMAIIKTMKILADKKLRIDRAILLGVAIVDDDPDIAAAITASRRSNINVYHPQDYILRHIFGSFGLVKDKNSSALGSFGYAFKCRKDQLFQVCVTEYVSVENFMDYAFKHAFNHNISNYLYAMMKNIEAADRYHGDEIDLSTAKNLVKLPENLIPGIVPLPVPRELTFLLKDEVIDSYGMWQLIKIYSPERKIFKKRIPAFTLYVVRDPRDQIFGWCRNRQTAEISFGNIKKQISGL